MTDTREFSNLSNQAHGYDLPALTDERILDIAHRKATRYAHSAIGTAEPAFAFNTTHMIDFARAIEKEIRG